MNGFRMQARTLESRTRNHPSSGAAAMALMTRNKGTTVDGPQTRGRRVITSTGGLWGSAKPSAGMLKEKVPIGMMAKMPQRFQAAKAVRLNSRPPKCRPRTSQAEMPKMRSGHASKRASNGGKRPCRALMMDMTARIRMHCMQMIPSRGVPTAAMSDGRKSGARAARPATMTHGTGGQNIGRYRSLTYFSIKSRLASARTTKYQAVQRTHASKMARPPCEVIKPDTMPSMARLAKKHICTVKMSGKKPTYLKNQTLKL
mmetsp:Transcript_23132/g.58428  ORF Transcript_23132/g.58428 Transcript_23132/m.58428 type:complete len:258 (+) Transcript_23132:245-1018(+)